MSESLSTLRCPDCDAPNLIDMGDGSVRCQQCGSSFVHPDRVCSQCGTVNKLDDLDCQECGQALRILCPTCETPNPRQAKACRQCGRPLDVLASVVERLKPAPDFLYERGAEAGAIKQREEQASRERITHLLEKEQAYEQRLAASRARQQQREQFWFKVAWAFTVIVIVMVIISFVAILLLRGG